MPFPPSVNGMWRTVKGRKGSKGRQILSKRARDYRKKALAHLHEIGLAGTKLDGRLAVTATLHPPTLRRYDCDNHFKAIGDSLTHAGFWLDDEQVDILTIKKAAKISGGLVVMRVCLV